MNRVPVLTHSEHKQEQERNYLLSWADGEGDLLPQYDLAQQFFTRFGWSLRVLVSLHSLDIIKEPKSFCLYKL